MLSQGDVRSKAFALSFAAPQSAGRTTFSALVNSRCKALKRQSHPHGQSGACGICMQAFSQIAGEWFGSRHLFCREWATPQELGEYLWSLTTTGIPGNGPCARRRAFQVQSNRPKVKPRQDRQGIVWVSEFDFTCSNVGLQNQEKEMNKKDEGFLCMADAKTDVEMLPPILPYHCRRVVVMIVRQWARRARCLCCQFATQTRQSKGCFQASRQGII